MADTVFLVHGMGNHVGDWHKPIGTALKRQYSKYERLKAIPFDDRFEIVPIGYDEKFRQIVSAWQASADAVGQVADGFGADDVENLVGWLRDDEEITNDFVWTHAADVLLYRLFFLVRQQIKTHVALLILKKVSALSASQRWSVLAHSLGTAVVHDALDMIWTGKIPDGATDGGATGFEPQHEQALCIAMVANVSRVLQTTPQAYEGTVKPGAAGQAGRGCLSFLNFRHHLDPFTIPKMFKPQLWPDRKTVERGGYKHIEVDHIHDVNVHSIEHYLKHPAVHIPLFRQLTFSSAITLSEEREARESFKQFGALTREKWIEFQGQLEERVPRVSAAWTEYKKIWDDFDELL